MKALALGLVLLGVAGCVATSQNPASKETSLAPAIAFRVDEDLNRLIVTWAEPAADWSRLDVSVTRCMAGSDDLVPVVGAGEAPWVNEVAQQGSQGQISAASQAGACGAGTRAHLTNDAAPVRTGDYLDFCVQSDANAAPGGGTLTSVELDLFDGVARRSLDSYLFADFSSC